MPKKNEVVLDEYEAKIYDHMMLFRDDPETFAKMLVSTQKEIAHGDLLVRKDMVKLIIDSLPKEEKTNLLDAIYQLRLDTMQRIGTDIMYGKKFNNTKSLGRFKDYGRFCFKAAGLIAKKEALPKELPFIDTVAEYLGWDEQEFLGRAKKLLENDNNMQNVYWPDKQKQLRAEVGLRVVMQTDEEVLQDVEVDFASSNREYYLYMKPSAGEYMEKFADQDAENRKAIREEFKGYAEEAKKILSELKPYEDKLPERFLERMNAAAKFDGSNNYNFIYLLDAIHLEDKDKKRFADYYSELKAIDPALEQVVEHLKEYSEKVVNALYDHVQKGDIPRNLLVSPVQC